MKAPKFLKAIAAPALAGAMGLFASVANAGVLNMEVWVEPDASVGSLAAADAVIAGGAADYVDSFQLVDHDDAQGNQGLFPNNIAFPNGGAVGNIQNRSLVVRVTGNVYIDTAGDYSFGTRNNDGVRVRLNGSAIITDSGVHGPQSFFSTGNNLTEGLHSIEIVFYEFNQSAVLEFFAAAGNTTDINDFELVGDTANGGLALMAPTPVTTPASLALVGAGIFGLLASRRSARRS